MKKYINWGIIGYGNASCQFIESFGLNENNKINTLASKSKKNILEKHKYKTNKITNSYIEVINDSNIDIIFIGLPNHLHYEWAKLSLLNKKNVLIEKPACIKPSEFEELMSIAKENKLHIFEGIYFRSHPNIQKIFDIIDDNNFERMKSVKSSFGMDALGGKKIFGLRLKKPKKSNRLFNPDSFGGSIWDLGCYPILFANLFIKKYADKYLNINDVIKVGRTMGSTAVDLDSELDLTKDKIKIKLKTSLINKLKNSILIEYENGQVEVENLLNIGKKIKIEIICNNNKNIHILDSKEDVFSNFKNLIYLNIIDNKKLFSFPSISNEETLENIKLLKYWREEVV